MARLFTEDAKYRASPYEESEIGHAAIEAFWLDDDGETLTIDAVPVAVEGRPAVVRVEVRYGEPVRQEHRDLWVLRGADDGRVEDYEEWGLLAGQGALGRRVTGLVAAALAVPLTARRRVSGRGTSACASRRRPELLRRCRRSSS